MRGKNGIPSAAKPRLVFQNPPSEGITPNLIGKMTLKEFISNAFGAAFFVFCVWLYTVAFTLLFAPQ